MQPNVKLEQVPLIITESWLQMLYTENMDALCLGDNNTTIT